MTEKELILTDILQCDRVDLYLDSPQMTDQQKARFELILAKRKLGEPLQYLIGHADFYGLKFSVNPHTFIPRPETEILVEKTIEKSKKIYNRPIRILELGTGSGNIAVSLAKCIAPSFVTAVEISSETIEVAKENAGFNGVQEKIKFLNQDMRLFLTRDTEEIGKYDLMVSNPPYIPSDQIPFLPLEIQKEPEIALNGGKEGLDYYECILQNAEKFLVPGGHLLMEIGWGQKKGISALLDRYMKGRPNFFVKDFGDIDRIVIVEF